jgi:hypothetical protein
MISDWVSFLVHPNLFVIKRFVGYVILYIPRNLYLYTNLKAINIVLNLKITLLRVRLTHGGIAKNKNIIAIPMN